jgi:hypothetical protein
MSENARRATGGGWTVLAVGMLVVLPLLYVASVGPAYRLVSPYDPAADVIETFYSPLWWTAQHWPAVYYALLRYTGTDAENAAAYSGYYP